MTDVRLDHVAIGARAISDAPAILEGIFGGEPHHGGPSPGFDWMQWRFANDARIEVLEPNAPDSFMTRFIAQRGPGVHHVTFKVPDLDGFCARARGLGYEIVGYDASNPGWQQAFLHPKQAQGIVVQVVHEEDDDDGEWQPRPGWSPPPRAERRAAPVSVIGPRLRARTAERARRQWSELLEGQVREDAGSLLFRWPDSPLEIRVDVAPDVEEGPIEIRLAADRALELPAAGFPELGTRFVCVPETR